MSMGVPGKEGLEPQFRVGDRVEVIDGHENDYGLGYKGNITWLSDEFARLDGSDDYIRQHRLKLLPELMICPKADKSCVCTHKEPHERSSTWFACDGVCMKHGKSIACIPYVEEQMVDCYQLVKELSHLLNIECRFTDSDLVTTPAQLRTILAPYMEGSDGQS